MCTTDNENVGLSPNDRPHTKMEPDPYGHPGLFRYELGNLEMIYGPDSGRVFHLQPNFKK